MKKLLQNVVLFGALFLLGVLGGCQTTPGAPAQTPAQIAARVCPPITAGLVSLQAIPQLSASDLAGIAKVSPMVDLVCSSSATVNITNLQTLGNTGFPAVIAVVQSSGLDPDKKQRVIGDIAALQVIFDIVLAADPQAAAIVIPSK